MSEEYGVYNTPPGLVQTLEAFKNRPCALLFSDEGYQPPSPDEVAQLIKLAGWSQNDCAKLVGVVYNPKKGSATVRRWKASPQSKEHRSIPYAAWRLLLLYANVVQMGH